MHFFYIKDNGKKSKLTEDLIVESFALCSSAEIAILMEHLGGQSDELLSI